MMKNLAQPSCTNHDDCDFFDCRGWCELETGKCTKQRSNNNLQVRLYFIDHQLRWS